MFRLTMIGILALNVSCSATVDRTVDEVNAAVDAAIGQSAPDPVPMGHDQYAWPRTPDSTWLVVGGQGYSMNVPADADTNTFDVDGEPHLGIAGPRISYPSGWSESAYRLQVLEFHKAPEQSLRQWMDSAYAAQVAAAEMDFLEPYPVQRRRRAGLDGFQMNPSCGDCDHQRWYVGKDSLVVGISYFPYMGMTNPDEVWLVRDHREVVTAAILGSFRWAGS